MNDSMVNQIVDEARVGTELRRLSDKLPEHHGSAIVCTSELTPEQIRLARVRGRLVVRADGVGFALMLNWKRRKAARPGGSDDRS